MARSPQLDILPPNHPEGYHHRRGERIERKTVQLGTAKWIDHLYGNTFVECDIRILCGAGAVSLSGNTFERCTFRPRRELSNLRFTDVVLRGCTFVGKYSGCRFGRELEDQAPDIRDCDFSGASLFHLCDFPDGSDVGSMRWPAWPHIVVADLPRSSGAWLGLRLPGEFRSVQNVIGDPDQIGRAITVYLPALTDRAEELRELFASQSYILISDPGAGLSENPN